MESENNLELAVPPPINRSSNWSGEETDALLDILSDPQVKAALEPGNGGGCGIRNRHVYEKIAQQMTHAGYFRPADSVKCRIQNLKASYKNALFGKKGSCRGHTLARIWPKLDYLWGTPGLTTAPFMSDAGSTMLEPISGNGESSLAIQAIYESPSEPFQPMGAEGSKLDTDHSQSIDFSPSSSGQYQSRAKLSTNGLLAGSRKRIFEAEYEPESSPIAYHDSPDNLTGAVAQIADILERNHQELMSWEREKEQRRAATEAKRVIEAREIEERHRREDREHQVRLVTLLADIFGARDRSG